MRSHAGGERERRLHAPQVAAACELLGLDPLFVANEGKLAAVVESQAAERILQAMRAHPLGRRAARIGDERLRELMKILFWAGFLTLRAS